jgi:hypothetical protein
MFLFYKNLPSTAIRPSWPSDICFTISLLANRDPTISIMKLSSFSALAGCLLLPFCTAQSIYSLDPRAPGFTGNNLTISLFQTSTPQACADGAGTPTKGIGFTTNSYSVYMNCWNVDELFADNSSTNGLAQISLPPNSAYGTIPPFLNGWNYTLLNRGNYQPGASFDGVYIESTNTTADGVERVGQGKVAGRRVAFFTSHDCRTLFSNYTAISYGVSCQTQPGGQCHQTQPIRSFRIQSYSETLLNFPTETQCTGFTQYSAATSRSVATGLAIGVSSVLALWLAL